MLVHKQTVSHFLMICSVSWKTVLMIWTFRLHPRYGLLDQAFQQIESSLRCHQQKSSILPPPPFSTYLTKIAAC